MKVDQRIVIELQYLPPAPFMALLCSGAEILIEQHEHYTKGSYRNRCQITGANGPMRLSIPLIKGKNQQQPIREVRIAYYEPWQAQHWQSIRSGYGSAPFFIHYADALRPFYEKRFEWLFDFNEQMLNAVISLLKLPVALKYTDSYHASYSENNTLDMRQAIRPGATLPPAPPYGQVFTERHGFLPHLSIIDLLFCLGPAAVPYLRQLAPLVLDQSR